jgi:hypothetical protein
MVLLAVADGVGVGEPVPLAVPLAVELGVLCGVPLGVVLPLQLVLAVLLGLAPVLRLGVADMDSVLEGEEVNVPVVVAVPDGVGVAAGVEV